MEIENELSQLAYPLAVVRLEQKKICLGHSEYSKTYLRREKAKKSAENWLKNNQNNPIYKTVDYDIKKISGHMVFHLFTHTNDIKDCNHCFFLMFREVCKIQCKTFVEFLQFQSHKRLKKNK